MDAAVIRVSYVLGLNGYKLDSNGDNNGVSQTDRTGRDGCGWIVGGGGDGGRATVHSVLALTKQTGWARLLCCGVLLPKRQAKQRDR